MKKFLLYVACMLTGALTLRAPNPITGVAFLCCLGLLFLNKDQAKTIVNKLTPESMSEKAYEAAISIPESHQALIDKIIFIDDLYNEEKVKKSKATFYEHILPKLVMFHDKQKQLADIPKARNAQSSLEDEEQDQAVYRAVEDWCDSRIKAYKENLTLDADIDKEVLIKLTKYL